MADDQVIPIPDNQDQNSLGWRAALPDEYKNDEFVKTFQKPGDFVKSAIEIKTDRDALKAQMANVIPKLSDKATDEERNAYFKAIGRPDKPEEYEFTGDNLEPKSVEWAKPVFHKYGLTKDQAKGIQGEFNSFMQAQEAAYVQTMQSEKDAAEAKLRTELGDKYNEQTELAKRFWKDITNSEFDTFVNETKIGNDPRLFRFITGIIKKVGYGEGNSPINQPSAGAGPEKFDATKFYEATKV